jgi:hypothetical protein
MGVEPKRIAAAFAATAAALATMVARADDLPGAYGGHGVSFSYPATWLHSPGQFEVTAGTPLWQEFFGPQPAAPAPQPTDPSQPQPQPQPQPAVQRDLVAVAAFHTNIAVTKKLLPRLKPVLALMVARLAAQTGGALLSGPQRITMGGMAGYRFQTTANLDPATTTESRLVFVFKGKTEYFLNCQHVQNGPLAAEIESGCDQVMTSFRLTK